MKETEQHPLPPFLPPHARVLMLGSFPPPRKRWSMDFFYPNMQNDMWRIFGLHFFGDKDYFVNLLAKRFRKELIIEFLTQRGIALYDTATTVCRLQDNASDKFLEVVEPTDISLLLRHLPQCQAIVTTGQKATDILCEQFSLTTQPSVGGYITFETESGRTLRLYRMPSSSRAYPLALEKKAAVYGKMFEEVLSKNNK
ncbi:MAG: uracil-DNA glycosylase family protein [Bacteroidaceae bacterium]|nr:uracil-DNA glycosylase family protein [Bacteroidaceae bacterium]